MIKTLFALLALSFSLAASAEICTAVIQDSRGYEWETFTRSSYSMPAACDQAQYDCNSALSWARSQGRYYDAQCVLKWQNDPGPWPNPYPNPYPNPNPNPNPYPNPGPGRDLMCQTDLVDIYGRVVRSFTALGPNEPSACAQSDNFCKSELSRNDSYGSRCVTRGIVNRPGPVPPRMKTESCTANRYDPAGMFIQSYMASATGPWDSDVRGAACRQAYNDCSRDLRGRQTCQIR